jgi:hypothetical protein
MYSKLIVLAAMMIALTGSAFADVKIKSKQTMSGQTYENTTYIKGKRQRSEMMNGTMVNITQCDLRRGLQINPATQTYMVNPFTVSTETTTKPASASVDANGVVQAGGTVTMTVTIRDTGERKQMFGFTARHLIITTEMASSPDACSKTKMKMETDGWYIDFESQFDCGDSSQYSGYRNGGKGGCQDKYIVKNTGSGKRGYPVYEKTTMFDDGGKETMSYVNEVVELSKATLDASLFDVPQGYKEVSDPSQMYTSASNLSVPKGSNGSAVSGLGSPSLDGPNGLPTASTGSVLAGANTQKAAATDVGAKKDGTIRIGLANVKTGAVGEGLVAGELAAAVQNSLREYLKVPNVEVVVLDGKLASAIDAEAKLKECDLVVYANVAHKKGGGGFGMFKAIAPVLSSVAPVAGMGSTAGAIAGSVASTAIYTTANLSGNVKAKDELTLDIKAVKADGSSALTKQIKVKAKSNGEDIISAAVEQAAQSIVDTLGK